MMGRCFRDALVCSLAAAWFLAAGAVHAQDDARAAPTVGLSRNTPRAYVLTGAKIVAEPGKTYEKGVIVVRDGRIESIGNAGEITPPADAQVFDLAGKTIYPGLIDSYTETAFAAPPREQGAPYWNAYITPQLSAAKQYSADNDLNGKLRRQGVVARLVAPSLGVIRGTSAIVSTGEASNSEAESGAPGNNAAIIADRVAQHLRLTVPRRQGRSEEYPASPMGAVALARQAFYDARWYDEARKRASGAGGAAPDVDEALAALAPEAQGNSLYIADAPNELFVLRADLFAREFGLNLAVRGSGYEYLRLDAIKQTGRTIITPVFFPKPPNVGSAQAARSAALDDLMHWDMAPENPARLEKAGVRIALTSHLLPDKGEFLAGVRKAVARGLSPEAALAAMTTTPAELFGVRDRLGSLAAGRPAHLVVASGDLFNPQTKILETWVAGRRYEHSVAPLFDLRGEWEWQIAGEPPGRSSLTVAVTGEVEKLSATAKLKPNSPSEAAPEAIGLTQLSLRDSRIAAAFPAKSLGREGVAQLSAVLVAAADGSQEWQGSVTWPDGSNSQLSAKRMVEPPAPEESKASDPPKAEAAALFSVNYPLGPFGRQAPPEQSKKLLLRGATIWTNGPAGVLQNGSVLIGDGKIIEVGANIEPGDATVVDVSGKHISAGIIDCHSHMGTDGGVNEGTQAVTAEVRIGDFIDCDDIDIYRQLAGGVTAANVLHGSANPIGGQNQVIKLRWGALPEEMKFAGAPAGIKFALGENVKQSNWGERFTSRYPQSRMGVEQIIRDRFQAAKEYKARQATWNAKPEGLPVRRDLELDAIAEILDGQRWIHCHSYRQDEILALLRTCEEFKITIATLQHVLEGYKVADAISKHGAMGSSFSDWWAYKFEVIDAIPYNGALMFRAGVVVSFNSDDQELARRLNTEAAKAVKYGNVPPEEALKFVTLNPAKQLRIDSRVGSLEAGKDADLVVWSGSPLSTFSRCEQTWVDGRKYFDLGEDAAARKAAAQMRAALVQKILASGQATRGEGEPASADDSHLWPRYDEYCHLHDHDHDHDHDHENENDHDHDH
jgi:imidazolonepropionase-like amidohydrolase